MFSALLMTPTLNPQQLKALSRDLAEIAQRYNQSPADSLTLRQYRTTEDGEDGEDVLFVVGEDEQGKEWIVVKVSLIPPSTEELSLKFDLCQTH